MSSLPFKVGERLGGGAFAEVFRIEGKPQVFKWARAEALDDRSATGAVFFARGVRLGTGSMGIWSPSPNAVLRSEVAQLRGIKTPGFVKVLSDGDHEGRSYAVLEHLDGQTWRSLLGTSQPPTARHVAQAVAMLAQAQRAKELAWHGDIKPENLYLSAKGAVRIADPCSGLVERDKHDRVTNLLVADTYNPLAEPSDFFAVGVLLLEVLGGQNCLISPEISSHDIGPRLRESLRGAMITGRGGSLYQRIATMPLPKDAAPELEAVALRCMRLQRQGTALETAEGFSSMTNVAEALEAATR